MAPAFSRDSPAETSGNFTVPFVGWPSRRGTRTRERLPFLGFRFQHRQKIQREAAADADSLFFLVLAQARVGSGFALRSWPFLLTVVAHRQGTGQALLGLLLERLEQIAGPSDRPRSDLNDLNSPRIPSHLPGDERGPYSVLHGARQAALPQGSFLAGNGEDGEMIGRILIAVALVGAPGCATAMGGRTTGVQVLADPGASVTHNGAAVGMTPATVEVSRKDPGSIEVAMPCGTMPIALGKSFRMTSLLNFVLGPVGLVGLGVDALTGGMWAVDPSVVGGRCVGGEVVGLGEVVVGMTAAQVRSAWGAPTSVNRTSTAGGTDEQWVYGLGWYVYLEDGVVTAIQSSAR